MINKISLNEAYAQHLDSGGAKSRMITVVAGIFMAALVGTAVTGGLYCKLGFEWSEAFTLGYVCGLLSSLPTGFITFLALYISCEKKHKKFLAELKEIRTDDEQIAEKVKQALKQAGISGKVDVDAKELRQFLVDYKC